MTSKFRDKVTTKYTKTTQPEGSPSVVAGISQRLVRVCVPGLFFVSFVSFVSFVVKPPGGPRCTPIRVTPNPLPSAQDHGVIPE